MTIRRGDILWADLGMFPTTSVQGGVRPVIVVSNNTVSYTHLLKNIFYRHFQVMCQPDCNLKRGISFSTFDAARCV